MNRTRAMFITGIFMLVLAVLAGLELRHGDPESSGDAQMITGSLDRHAVQESMQASGERNSGVLVPLDSGTLREADSGRMPSIPSMPNAGGKYPESQIPLPARFAEKPLASALPAMPVDVSSEEQHEASVRESGAVLSSGVKPPVAQQPQPLQQRQQPEILRNPAREPVQNSVRPQNQEKSQTVEKKQPPINSVQKAAQTTPPKEKPKEQTKEQPKAKPAEKEQPVVVTAKNTEKPAGKQKAITQTRLEMGKGINFRISAESALAVKTILLEGPDRYVVDLQGDWGINLPKIPKNLLLNDIRTGRHPDATRLVFGLKHKPESAQVVKIDAKTVEVRIR